MVQRISSPIFIGRELQLERVSELRSRALAAQQGATILVSGEAGIGKSRFCAELAAIASRDGWLVLKGTCDEFGATAQPLSAVVEMVPSIEAAIRTKAPEELDRPAWLALQALVSGVSAATEPGSVAQLIVELFRRLALVQPLCVIFDDFHWADESSRVLFATVARGIKQVPSVLVGAYRGDEIGRGHPLRTVLSTVHRNSNPEVIELAALDREEAARLARAVGRTVSEDFEAAFERSGGNAFYLEELLATRADAMPRGVQEVVLARIDALGPGASSIAEAASLGTGFSSELLATVTGLEPGEFADALDHLTERGILRPHGTEFHYRHALLRDIVYDRIPAGRRPMLHRKIAEGLEATEPSRSGEIARHWRLTPDRPRALVSSLNAARAAYSIGAKPEAADHYEAALELWGDIPQPEVTSKVTRAQLVEQACWAFYGCGRRSQGARLLKDLLESDEELSAADRARLWTRLRYHLWLNEEATTRTTLQESWLASVRSVQCLDESVDAVTAVIVLSGHAQQSSWTWGHDFEGLALVERARPFAETAGPGEHQLLYLAVVSGMLMAVGDPAADESVDAFALAMGEGGSNSGYWFSPMLLSKFMDLGRNEECIYYGRLFLDRMTESGHEATETAAAAAHLGTALVRLGRWREALDLFDTLNQRFGGTPLQRNHYLGGGWGAALARSGRGEDVRPWLDSTTAWTAPIVRDETPDHTMGTWIVGQVELARVRNDPRSCRQDVTDVVDQVRGHLMAYAAEPVAYAIGLEADSAFEAGKPDPDVLALAGRWVEQLAERLAEAPGRARISDYGMFLAQARLELERFAGNDDPSTWEELAERWQAMPRPYNEAYCRYRAAFALLMAPVAAERKVSRERAATHLDAAMAIAKELGAIYLEADVTRLRVSAGLGQRSRTSPTTAVVTATAVDTRPVVTARELEVLRLVVAGESNGQIAIRLGISVKTASVHVSNILRKLDADNRVEAAVRATRTGLVELHPR